MWIDNNIAKPLKKGLYKSLVEEDGVGNLEEYGNETFNGVDWDLYESNSNFIRFWWAEEDEYIEIMKQIDTEREIIENTKN